MNVSSARRLRWLGLLVLPAAVIGGPLALSDVFYANAVARAPVLPFPACRKVWAHRGHAATGGANSLQSVEGAFARGAAGVEIDILFDHATADFVVSHARPYTLFGGKPLRLETVLSQHAGAGFFWLDAKDLRSLSPAAALEATQRLFELLRRHGLMRRALVESSNPLYVSWLAARGVPTSLSVSPNDQKYSAPVVGLHIAAIKLAYAFSGAGAISMTASRYTPGIALGFRGAPVLLSTVNDPVLLRHFAADPSVKVILSDDDHYSLASCAETGVHDASTRIAATAHAASSAH